VLRYPLLQPFRHFAVVCLPSHFTFVPLENIQTPSRSPNLLCMEVTNGMASTVPAA